MKKLFVTLFAVAAVSTALATDSYLYWFASPTSVGGDYSYAVLTGTGGDIEFRAASDASGAIAAAFTETAAITEGGSYYLELFNDSDVSVWKGYTFTYAELQQMGALLPDGASGPFKGSPVDMAGVPEPTSGLMMLLGFALLGLKRKRV